jgi:hypothetical protein
MATRSREITADGVLANPAEHGLEAPRIADLIHSTQGRSAHPEHFAQFYVDDRVLIDSVGEFVAVAGIQYRAGV